ncbi:dsDNA nuclease domain-containing protein [Nocardiopsis sp. L17-MgMaSL7]|uniref:dsDNA nuclease domain-containing protein n=1 Tax=Nocardiopsis sp. L17-MgMaSL7 TaxID=1938893 RepID=UPI000D7134F6|nr:tetratricopeptide repeat protein [Nocardiopsis sp. L17-MgMaSL7]PWV54849.1 uncharacterized protein DUF4297 [Nocardiopsis sp. L17-MgMaSL7]
MARSAQTTISDQDTIANIVLSRPPRENDGEATHGRYHWQTQVAVRRVFELLLAHLDAEIRVPAANGWVLVCEWHEDFCVLHAGEAELCAVKHRETTRSRWSDKDLLEKGGLLHLFRNWWYLDRSCRASLYTNSDLLGHKAQRIKLAAEILHRHKGQTLSEHEEKLIREVVEAMGRIALKAHLGRGAFTLPQELASTAQGEPPSFSLRRHLRSFLEVLTLITDLPERNITNALLDSDTIRPCLEHLGIPKMLTEDAWDTVENLVLQGMRGERDVRRLEHGALGFQILLDPAGRNSPEVSWATRVVDPRQVMEALRKRARGAPTGRHGIARTIGPPGLSFIDNTSHGWSHLPWDGGPILITGGAGIGKTSTARRFAELARNDFPHGQLLVDARGFGPSPPMSTEEIVEILLGQLGERRRTGDEMLEERCMRFTDIIEEGRYLVVLDNVSETETVRPLLPAKCASAVIITSRRPLSDFMISHQATRVHMGPLPPDRAHELLRRLVGEGRLATDPVATNQLLAVCGGIPLAITILAAHLNQLPDHPLSRFMSELDDPDDRLDLFELGEERSSIRTVFSWTFHALEPELREVFVLFGACPAPDLDPEAAGALLQISRPRTALRRLQQFNLVTERSDGRFQMHDLLRDYAVSLSNASDELQQKIDRANARIAQYYARLASSRSEAPPHHDQYIWVHQNIDALLSIIAYCSQNEAVDDLWAIVDAITEYLWHEGRLGDCTNTLESALSALGPDTPPERRSYYLRQQSVTMRRRGLHDESIRYAQESLSALGPTASNVDAADSHYELAVACSYAGSHEKAVTHYQHALQGFHGHQDEIRTGDALNGLGWSISESGDPTTGLAYCQQAWDIHRSSKDRNREAADLDSIAYIRHQLGEHEASLENYRACLRIYTSIHHRSNEARTLDSMGDLYKDMGDVEEARSSWEQALALFEAISSPSEEKIRTKMNGLA